MKKIILSLCFTLITVGVFFCAVGETATFQVLAIPATIEAGLPLVGTVAQADKVIDYVNFQLYDVDNIRLGSRFTFAKDDGLTIDLLDFGLDPGIYRLECSIYCNDSPIDETHTVTVTGARPSVPDVSVTATEVILGDSVTFSLSYASAGIDRMAVYNGSSNPSNLTDCQIHEGVSWTETRTHTYQAGASDFYFRAQVDGRWSDFTQPIAVTWNTLGKAPTPQLDVPATLRAGEPFEIGNALVGIIGESLTLTLSRDGQSIDNYYDLDIEDNGHAILDPYGLDAGSYTLCATRSANRYENSDPASYSITVSGARPAAPTITVPATPVEHMVPFQVQVATPGIEAAIRTNSYENTVYLGHQGIVTLYITDYNWSSESQETSYEFRARVNGCWSEIATSPTVTINPQPQPQEEEHNTEVSFSDSIQVGQDLAIRITDPDLDAPELNVSIVMVGDNNIKYKTVIYEMALNYAVNSDGSVSTVISGSTFDLPGCYRLTFYGLGNQTAECYLQVEGASDALTPPTVELLNQSPVVGEALTFQLTAPVAQLFTLRIYTPWSGDDVYDEQIAAVNGQATYTWSDGGYSDWEYTAIAMCYADGMWSQYGEPLTFQVASASASLPEMMLSAPSEVLENVPFTVSWQPVHGAERYIVKWFIYYDDTHPTEILLPASATSVELTIHDAHQRGRTEAYLTVCAHAAGMVSSEGYASVKLLAAISPNVSAVASTVDVGETTYLSVTGVMQDALRIRVNGRETGQVTSLSGSTQQMVPFEFYSPGTYTVQVSYVTLGSSPKYSAWSDPVTFTVRHAAVTSELRLPSGTRTIADEAFRGIAAQRVVIPHGCQSISPYAFADCPNLTTVEIPQTVTEIDSHAFDGCNTLTIITSSGSYAEQYANERQWNVQHN